MNKPADLLRALFFLSATPLLIAQASDARTVGNDATSEPTESAASPAPFSNAERFKWAALTAVSTRRFVGYTFSSAISTGANSPHEYGPHWDGFAKRIGLRASTGATGLMLEAGVGALWGEDPRYVRARDKPVKSRLANIFRFTFMARNRYGETVPAYARYIAVPANSFISNTWRADSHATVERAAGRIPTSFLDRMIANTFTEFWPELSRILHAGKK